MKVASHPCVSATPLAARLYITASSVARSTSARCLSVSSICPGEYSEITPSSGIPCASHAAHRSRRNEIGRHTSELQSLMRISYAVFCLKKKKNNTQQKH